MPKGPVIRPPFVHFSQTTHGKRRPLYFVFHTTESNDAATVEEIASYLQNQTPGYGINYITQANGRCGSLGDFFAETWHVEQHNNSCIGNEQVGTYKRSRMMWYVHLRQLWASAWIAAWVSQELDIPLRIGALNRRWVASSGFCQHRDVPDNDHVDCGDGFPIGWVLGRAKAWCEGGVPVWVRRAVPKP
jgi:hypothetical protein